LRKRKSRAATRSAGKDDAGKRDSGGAADAWLSGLDMPKYGTNPPLIADYQVGAAFRGLNEVVRDVMRAFDSGSARSARQNKVSRGSAEEREQSPRERAEELRHPPAPFLSSENSYTLGSLSQLGARRLVVALSSRNLDPQYSCTSHTQRMGRQGFVCVQIQSARHSSGPSL